MSGSETNSCFGVCNFTVRPFADDFDGAPPLVQNKSFAPSSVAAKILYTRELGICVFGDVKALNDIASDRHQPEIVTIKLDHAFKM